MMKVSCFSNALLSSRLRTNLCQSLNPRALSTTLSKGTDAASTEAKEERLLPLERFEENEDKERQIELSRNKSRLYPQHRNILHDKPGYNEETPVPYGYVKTLMYKRRMYGRYGSISNVDPRIAWPTKEELATEAEYVNLACPKSIQQMVEEERTKHLEKEKEGIEKDKKIVANFAKLNVWKEELKAKITKKQAEAEAAKSKRARLIEEVRRHVGYAIDPRDPKFEEILAMKQLEEKKALKAEKKKKKEEEMIAKMLKLAEDDKKEREGKKQPVKDVKESEPPKE